VRESDHRYFRRQLLLWHQDIDRGLPWKKDPSPYKIWLSEIILQQTRVGQGLAYYLRFIEAFPTIGDLATASEDQVLSLWKGLGYYARARNLHKAAQQVVHEFGGEFPTTYDHIISLSGVGPYTAAAIASFAYGKPYPVVDGNVFRVLSRYFGVETPIDTTEGKKRINVIAASCLDHTNPGDYNQAIMDFGALACKPALPSCDHCLLSERCSAYNNGTTDLLPIKVKKVTVKKRYFHYLVHTKGQKIYLHKRTHRDIWEGLYQPPLIEAVKVLSRKALCSRLLQDSGASNVTNQGVKKIYSAKQRLTHRLIHGSFYEVSTPPRYPGQWVDISDVHQFGLPKIVDDFLNFYFQRNK